MPRRWGIDHCRAFFGLTDAQEAWIAGHEGRRRMLAVWEAHPAAYDDDPLTLLRQEWWHAYTEWYRHPGFWDAVGPGGVVCDYGCGVGAVTLPWIARGEMALLVDQSPAVLAYLRHKLAPWGEALIQDCATFWAHNFRYDALVCVDVLEHLPNPLEVQQQLWDRLKPGGHALLKMESAYPHAGHLEASVAQFPAWVQWIKDHTDIVEIETYVWCRKRGLGGPAGPAGAGR